MYGLNYTASFSGPVNTYDVEIWQKGYSGAVTGLILGSNPILHQWETDDIQSPIRGASLKITVINKDLATPLTNFYSIEDDAFLIKLYQGSDLLFIGNLVQDDCSEVLVDFTHEINLSASDNLGLLKDITLDKTKILSDGFNEFSPFPFNVYGNVFYVSFPYDFQILPGDQLTVTGDPLINGDYTITSIVKNTNAYLTIYVAETPRAGYYYTAVIRITKQINLLEKQFLSTIIMMCLKSTGLDLDINVFTKMHEQDQSTTSSLFDQTKINPQSFLVNANDFDNCYSVLEKIMTAFRCSVFQVNGIWNIVHWDELRKSDNVITGYHNNDRFQYLGIINSPDLTIAGRGTDIVAETGLIKTLFRPLVSIKKTFNYTYPYQLLRNYDLAITGGLLREYTTGAGIDLKKIKEYTLPWWDKAGFPSLFYPGDYFIRVTTDDLDNEIERVIVSNGYLRSYPIEVNEGDSFKFNFDCRTEDSQSGPLSWVFYVEVTDGTNKYRFMNPALTSGVKWQSVGGGFTYQVPTGDNSNQWHSVEIDSSRYPIPVTGLMYVYLQPLDLSGALHETYYKDLRFEYYSKINQSTKIIGQTHTISQPLEIKNKQEEEIFIDDSPRNPINGTLFLNALTGIIQKRTSRWGYNVDDKRRLNEVLEEDEMRWRNQTRIKLEGSLYSQTKILSILNVLNYNLFLETYFLWGRLEIDYKEGKYSGTLYEKWNKNEILLPFNYLFDYIYDTK